MKIRKETLTGHATGVEKAKDGQPYQRWLART